MPVRPRPTLALLALLALPGACGPENRRGGTVSGVDADAGADGGSDALPWDDAGPGDDAAPADADAAPDVAVDEGVPDTPVEATLPLVLNVILSPDPPTTGTNTVEITVSGQNGILVTGALIEITPWMVTHGHGSPSTPIVEELGGGIYRSTNVVFTMAGRWDLYIDIDALGTTSSFTHSVTVGG